MAVYTHLSAENLSGLIAHYDVGELVSAKGIAEGVSNSNWLLETTGPDAARVDSPHGSARYILTMYERRIKIGDLPFFLGLLDHLSAASLPVPRTIHDRSGAAFRMVGNKAVALIEFLPGVSVDRPTPAQAHSVGKALAGMHLASADFAGTRENDLRPSDWQALLGQYTDSQLAQIDADLPEFIEAHLPRLMAAWPDDLPQAIIHADLFPDNVLMRGNAVSGLIDFYFACKDMAAYDLAVTHAAWCFDRTGEHFDAAVGLALLEGYAAVRPLSAAERDALPILAQGAAMRFVATRAADWIDTPGDALVTRKDPMEFARRLTFYAEHGAQAFTI
ncbi:Homoserine kinase [Alteripontixanthobacter maritimus]|uniref:Homoserine kinase n=1 Tax=Alteripontixanthobacter maritimus TaxID=2161824 RepID=A0A369Q333_9SPHN|nr:homoserine kinase [Alteripontixanthobacter maritimus]RDC59303.1 Homoserine kinase [Alteripontixanthobacter maritimus]